MHEEALVWMQLPGEGCRRTARKHGRQQQLDILPITMIPL